MTWVVLMLLVLIAYTYAGYPVLVALVARLSPWHARSERDFEPSISVALAVSNGEEFLAEKLESLLALDYPRGKLDFIVCSDGSTDATRAIVERYRELDSRVVLLDNPVRVGKPSTLNRIAHVARGDVLLMTDVRQPLSPNAARALVAPLADRSVGCVSGNLVLSGDSGAGAYWRYERFIRGSEGRLGRMVGVSGALYAIRREDLPELPADVILDDMFVPSCLMLRGKRVVFVDAARAYDRAFDDEREFSRKVRTLAGNYQLIAKLPMLLVPVVNRAWFQLVSHKLLRLVCPWALVALFGISTAGAIVETEIFWQVLALGQAAFYSLAAMGDAAGRAGKLARTFVVLNAAALVGLWRFARGSQAVTW